MSLSNEKTVDAAPPLWLAISVCVLLAVAVALLRLGLKRDWVLPIGYGVPIVVAAWTRRRTLVWVLAIVFTVTTVLKTCNFIQPMPARNGAGEVELQILSSAMVLLDLFVITLLVDVFLRRQQLLERRSADLLAVNHEIVARREVIARQNEAIQQQAAQIDQRRREAEESSVRKSRFLAAVSHDIRTPANAISLLAELLRRSAENPESFAEIPELAQELHNSAMSMVSLISDVLDLTRLDAGRVDLHESDFELNQLLLDDSKQLSPLAEEKGLEFKCRTPSEKIQLRADRIKLSRVLMNLIGNAIKFTEKGAVRIETALMQDGRVGISVTDTGIGIAPEHLTRIFDEFFQLKNPERNRQKGTGLGLSISRRLIEAMGGTLDVVSAPGTGSTFTVMLPAKSVIR